MSSQVPSTAWSRAAAGSSAIPGHPGSRSRQSASAADSRPPFWHSHEAGIPSQDPPKGQCCHCRWGKLGIRGRRASGSLYINESDLVHIPAGKDAGCRWSSPWEEWCALAGGGTSCTCWCPRQSPEQLCEIVPLFTDEGIWVLKG